jgi:hypothetical protein
MKFLVTQESQRLARWLRLCGYDTALAKAQLVSDLYRQAFNEGRIIVTRNRQVGAGRMVRAVHLTGHGLAAQLRQIREEMGIRLESEQAMTRCNRCNIELQARAKADVKERVPPYVFKTQERFYGCPGCGRVYWAATHYARVQGFLQSVGAP